MSFFDEMFNEVESKLKAISPDGMGVDQQMQQEPVLPAQEQSFGDYRQAETQQAPELPVDMQLPSTEYLPQQSPEYVAPQPAPQPEPANTGLGADQVLSQNTVLPNQPKPTLKEFVTQLRQQRQNPSFMHDLGQTISDHINGGVAGYKELQKQNTNLADMYVHNDDGSFATDENGNAILKPEYTQNDADFQTGMRQKALETWNNETVKPTVEFGAPLLGAPGLIAAAPFIGGDLAGEAAKGYDENGVGGAIRNVWYGPAADFVNDPNLGQRWQQHPFQTAAEGWLAALQAVVPVVGARYALKKGAAKVKSIQEEVNDSFNKALDGNPLEGMANSGLDALDQYDSPTRGFRPATADEMQQWNAEKLQGEVDSLGRIRDNQYAQVFERQPEQRFANESVADLPKTAQAEVVSPLADALNKAAQKKWDESESIFNAKQGEITSLKDYLTELEKYKQDYIDETVKYFKENPGGNGVTPGGLVRDSEGAVVDRFGRVSNNPVWYQEYYAKYGKKPTEKGLRDFAEEYLQGSKELPQGHQDFLEINSMIDNVKKQLDGEGVEYSVARQIADEVEKKLPNAEFSKEELVNKAYESAMQGDYETAAKYAMQSGDRNIVEAFKLLRDTNGLEKPPAPTLKGNVKGEYSKPNITKRTFLDRVSDIFAPIRTGRIGRAGVDGFVNHNTGIIRTKQYGDLDVAAHEVGHLVDAAMDLRGNAGAYDKEFSRVVNQRFGEGAYEPEQVRAEGIAEFMRDYSMNPVRAQKDFPNYYRAFENAINQNPDIRSRVSEFRDMAQTWVNQSPEARGRSGVSYSYETKPGIVERAKTAWFNVQERLLDDKVGLAKATEEAERIIGEKLSTEQNPYKQARLAQNSAVARAQMLVEDKNPVATRNILNEIYGGSVENAVTMKSILNGIENLSKKYPDYIKTGGFKDWREALDTLLVARRQTELQAYKPDYTGSMSREDAAHIIRNAPKELQEAAQKVYQYNDNLLGILRHEGLISQEAYEGMKQYKNYVSMARDFSDESAMIGSFGAGGKGFGNVRNPIRKISDEGSSRQVISPLESMVKNTYAMMNLVERNRVGRTFADLAEKRGVGKLVEEVSGKANTKDSVFSVWIDGEKKSYQTTPDLYRAIMSLNQEGSNFITKILGTPASWLRAGATLTPDFVFKNLTRDTFSSLVFTRYGFVPVIDHVKALSHMIKNDELYHEYKASGALQSTMVGLDRDYTNASIQELIKKSAWQKYNPIEVLRGFSEAIETATRLGEYNRARSKGASMGDAALSARDITLDFSKRGTWGKEANKIIAFFNAAIQEPNRIAQAFKENPAGTSAKIAMYITTPSVALWALNHDQDWYKELPDYQKDLFWLVKGGDTIFRIPKPFGLGVLFGSGAERALDYFYEKDPKAVKQWAKTFADSMLPNFIPTAAAPILEWQSNYSYFMDRKIVPDKELRLPDKLQYGVNTSELAKAIGEQFDLSPRKIDSAMQSLGGGMVRQSLNIADALAGKREFKEPFQAAFTADPNQSPKSIKDFYDAFNDAQKENNAAKVTRTQADVISKSNYRNLNNANEMMKKLNKQEREILNSDLPPEEKKKKVDALNERQVSLARAALKSLKK